MNFTLVAAISSNYVLGKDNQLLWKLSDDMKMFRALTTGNTVIMGRKTFESMGKALPNRQNIIVSRNPAYQAENCIVVTSLQNALMEAEKLQQKTFVIGGGEIYKQSIDSASELIITHVHCILDGDTFFPAIDEEIWAKQEVNNYSKNDKNEFDFEVIKYLRK
jgi:dihydrofolate reductase